jgi:hypothetical protein
MFLQFTCRFKKLIIMALQRHNSNTIFFYTKYFEISFVVNGIKNNFEKQIKVS